ncbi:GNAT family N-acetyltransferase [Aeromonas sp. MR7]|uniref:GNAT family N-acetyltransferase n=1 Tax=Aeromonas sp. MR7 TaxID=2923419 RepID=UPI001F4AFD37|nr:GNAT family N-acetyltransferase [Aeromonas sp. MR7]MCH7350083.1 GNAT family N-acetyltransferase [Aeromonas sp. MR7]
MTVQFKHFDDVTAQDFLPLLNDATIRKHLIDHPRFDLPRVGCWMDDKMRINQQPRCRVRAVLIHGQLAGWCGIQPDEDGVELAIVIDQAHWGAGIAIFREMMCWAREMGHTEVRFHLLDSRPAYVALASKACRVEKRRLSGRMFTTYCLSVECWFAAC